MMLTTRITTSTRVLTMFSNTADDDVDHPGGRGNAGGQHHHRISFDKYHPGYFGKVGMRYFHKTQLKLHCRSINLDRIWTLVNNFSNEQSQKDPTKVYLIDVTKQGYSKVLGKGQIPQPL